MRLSLRYRLLLPLVGLLLVELSATLLAARSAAAGVEEQLDHQLEAVSRTLTVPPTFPVTQRVLDQMKGLSGAEFILLLPDGRLLATLRTTSMPTPSSPGSKDVLLNGERYRGSTVRFPESHPNAGGTLGIFYPESVRQEAVRRAVLPLLFLGGIGGLLSSGVVIFLARQLTRRIAGLRERTQSIAGGLFQPMPLTGPDDELRDLSGSINHMTTQLVDLQAKAGEAERLRVLSQFAGGLAHQLRNAASGAKLAVQLHLADHPGEDPEALEVALRQLARIETNLMQFITLGRPPSPRRIPCDLAAILRQHAELLAPQCRHTNTRLKIDSAKELILPGDPSSLGHLVGNLLSNALEAAGPNGEVRASLEAMPSGVRLRVMDNGPGPPAAIADRLFDAFVTGREQGVGLGLAVVKQAVDIHGGSIRWERDDGWTSFIVEWPVS